ncbi:hypothetical protein GH714_041648 [Hevea brasiliensis]|uniref:RING-type E3 ubiquitin transferase n=1 Tax=Hevea brasiliensis TaxID=3981 RepID=A0A6A6MTF2_HEVBR|nr:hypothetical protein GH714_041648 [Hevea brasiliensis]
MRLSLRFAAVWSIRDTNNIAGYISSNKNRDFSGYFDRIQLRSYGINGIKIPGLKYEYTLVDRVRKLCPKMQPGRSEGMQYPGNSYDMQFHMSVKNSEGRRIGWGYANPVSMAAEHQLPNGLKSFNASSKKYNQVQISAEWIYDGEAVLCMVGCKYLDSSNHVSANDSMDCEILVHVQFPPINSKDYIEGRIESTREKSSSLYFQPVSYYAVHFHTHIDLTRRMDLEIIMALISNTLICVFVGYQIFYVKKYPGVFPFISLLMLVVLTLGRLTLNFEALLLPKQNSQSFLHRGGGWVEAKEVIIKVITMVAFLLQFWLLQLVWTARFADGNQKASWVAEKKALYVSLPLYIAGSLIAFFVNWRNYKLGNKEIDSVRFYRNQHSLWLDFRSYVDLALDGFLSLKSS